jgi:hypothetical protein
MRAVSRLITNHAFIKLEAQPGGGRLTLAQSDQLKWLKQPSVG